MDALAEKLDARLRQWKPETAAEARERIAELIELADHEVLDIVRSRAAEQEVLDLLDEPQPGEIWLTGDSLPRHVPSSSFPAKTPTRRGLSSCTCLPPPSGEIVRMNDRYRGFPFLNVNL